MIISLHPQNPNPRDLKKVIEILNKNGVVIFPTDTIYTMGCRMDSKKAMERMCKIAGKKPEKANLSLICSDLAHLSDFTAPLDKSTFRLVKNNLPGPFTFILPANQKVSKLFAGNKKTIGIRVPGNPIAQLIVSELGCPLLVSTIHSDDQVTSYLTDPEEIHAKFEYQADLVIDGGIGGNIPSTVVDCASDEIIITRQGKGILKN